MFNTHLGKTTVSARMSNATSCNAIAERAHLWLVLELKQAASDKFAWIFQWLTYPNLGRSIKYCPFADTSNQDTRCQTESKTHASQEVFIKTLGFFCALRERGCRWDSRKDAEVDDGSSGDSDEDEEEDKDLIWTLANSRTSNDKTGRCTGKFIFEFVSNRPLIRQVFN